MEGRQEPAEDKGGGGGLGSQTGVRSRKGVRGENSFDGYRGGHQSAERGKGKRARRGTTRGLEYKGRVEEDGESRKGGEEGGLWSGRRSLRPSCRRSQARRPGRHRGKQVGQPPAPAPPSGKPSRPPPRRWLGQRPERRLAQRAGTCATGGRRRARIRTACVPGPCEPAGGRRGGGRS